MRLHECPHPVCDVEVSATKLGCPPHWWQLPTELRHEVTVSYRFRAKSPEARRRHLVAVGAAVRWWRASVTQVAGS